ncbi:NUDIX hydrolase [Chloroflexus sp.]|uniref:NUDIX hydrolase n=1 Tax=Chloroflexus sp. TaxID=1904827 RepID=UPI0026291B3F|nr:NUDIX domain-containing protein [uncultured Chloroflexus sp.]
MTDTPIHAAGCVVLARDQTGRLLVLLIQDQQGVWTLPKGHVDDGESDEQAAVREVAEETGIKCEIAERLDRVIYPVYRRGRWRDKQVTFFLASATPEPPVPALAEGIRAASWVPLDEAPRQVGYRQLRALLQRVARRLGYAK